MTFVDPFSGNTATASKSGFINPFDDPSYKTQASAPAPRPLQPFSLNPMAPAQNTNYGLLSNPNPAPVDFSKYQSAPLLANPNPSVTPSVFNNNAFNAYPQQNQALLNTIPQQFQAGITQGSQGLDQTIQGVQNYNPVQIGQGLFQTAAGVGNAAFSPFAPVGAAINTATDAITNIPAVQQAAQMLPDLPYLQGAKIAGDVSAVAGLFGGVGGLLKGGKPTLEQARIQAATDVKPPEPQGLLPKTHAEYAASQGYEPYTPTEQLPTIQMGPKGESTLPTIQAEPLLPKPRQVPGDFTIEPLQPTLPKPTESAPIETQPVLPKPLVGKVTKAASDINQTLVKQGFDALPPEEQSKYTPQSYKATADTVASLMDSNIEQVKAIATGEKPVPKGVNGQILFNAVEAYATKTGDGELLSRLAASPLGKKLSEAGQTLGGHGFNDNPNSAVEAIRQVQEARQAKVGDLQKASQQITEQIRNEIKKAAPSKQTWASFVDSITC